MGLYPRGTILSLPCDDDLRDKSGSNNDGFFFNGAPYFDRYGVFRSCLRLNWSGQGTQYIHSAVTPITDPTEWTISLWFFLSDLMKNDAVLFVNGDWLSGFGLGITSDEGFGLAPFGSSPWGSNQYLSFFNTNAPTELRNTYAEFLVPNSWYHIGARRRDGIVSFFVNGEKIDYEYDGDVPAVDPTKGYYLGGMATKGYAIGKLDELIVSDKGLDDQEMMDLFMSFYPIQFQVRRHPVAMTFIKGQARAPKKSNIYSFAKFDPVNRIPASLTPIKMPSNRVLGNAIREFVVADTHEWAATRDIAVLERVTAYHAAVNLHGFVESIPRTWCNEFNTPVPIINPIIRYVDLVTKGFAEYPKTMAESTYVRGYNADPRTMTESTYVRGFAQYPQTMAESLIVRNCIQFFTESMINKLPFTYMNTVLERHIWKGNSFSDFAMSRDGKAKLKLGQLPMNDINRGFHEYSSLPFRIKQEFSHIVNMMIASTNAPKHCVLRIAQTPFVEREKWNNKILFSATKFNPSDRPHWRKVKDNTTTEDGRYKYGDLPLYNKHITNLLKNDDSFSKNHWIQKERMRVNIRDYKIKKIVQGVFEGDPHKPLKPLVYKPAPTPSVQPMLNVKFAPAPTPAVKDLTNITFNADPNVSSKALIAREVVDIPRPFHGTTQRYISTSTDKHRHVVKQHTVPSTPRQNYGTAGSFEATRARVINTMEKQWLKREQHQHSNKTAKASFIKYVDKKMKLSRDVSERFGRIKRFLVSCTPWKKEN